MLHLTWYDINQVGRAYHVYDYTINILKWGCGGHLL